MSGTLRGLLPRWTAVLSKSLSCFCAKVFFTDKGKHLIFQGIKECAEAAVGPDTSGGSIGFLKHYCGRTDVLSSVCSCCRLLV